MTVADGERGPRSYVVPVGYHQLVLAPLDVAPIWDGDDAAALLEIVEGTSAIVLTGIADGYVEVTLIDGPPPPAGSGWEESAAGELTVEESLYLTSPTTDSEVFDPVFVPDRPGRQQIAVRAAGRSAHPDESMEDETPAERYQIAIWSA